MPSGVPQGTKWPVAFPSHDQRFIGVRDLGGQGVVAPSQNEVGQIINVSRAKIGAKTSKRRHIAYGI
jgi:hypothetical protein